jgi:hypothetical protein
MNKWVLISVLLAACGSDSGEDSLPKRGERATDPTIVSVTARCSCGGEICSGGSTGTSHVRVRIDATDPMGSGHLGTCAATVDGFTDQGSFSEDDSCVAYVETTCVVGASQTVDITISNESGGVTSASVTTLIAPD